MGEGLRLCDGVGVVLGAIGSAVGGRWIGGRGSVVPSVQLWAVGGSVDRWAWFWVPSVGTVGGLAWRWASGGQNETDQARPVWRQYISSTPGPVGYGQEMPSVAAAGL